MSVALQRPELSPVTKLLLPELSAEVLRRPVAGGGLSQALLRRQPEQVNFLNFPMSTSIYSIVIVIFIISVRFHFVEN